MYTVRTFRHYVKNKLDFLKGIGQYFSMFKYILSLFDIDRTDNKWGMRILFLILFALRLSVVYFPIGDSDFSSLYNWANSVVSNPDLIYSMDYQTVPITDGNIIYIFSVLIIDFLCVIGAVIYFTSHVRAIRTHSNKAISEGKATAEVRVAGKGISSEPIKLEPVPVISIRDSIIRILILSAFMALVFIPVLFFAIYLFLIFIIAIPCIIMIPACYLSGDYKFWNSFSGAFKKVRGFYPTVLRDFSSVALVGICLSWLNQYTAYISYSLYYPLDAFITTFLFLVVGRCTAITYENLRVLNIFRKDFLNKQGNREE